MYAPTQRHLQCFMYAPTQRHLQCFMYAPTLRHLQCFMYAPTYFHRNAKLTQTTSRIFFQTQTKWSRDYKTCMKHQSKRPHFLCNILLLSSSMTSNTAELLKFQFPSTLPLLMSQLHFPKDFYLTALAHNQDKTECTKQYICANVTLILRVRVA